MAENKVVLYIFMGLMLILGTANTLIGKLMDLSKGNGHLFNHPYFQTAMMFAGELFCLGFYYLYIKCSKEANAEFNTPLQGKKLNRTFREKMGKFVFAIPSFFDFCASTLMFVGLVLSAPSVYQMMRGFIMVVVALYSVFFLKIKLFKHQIVGVALAFCGVALVGVASILFAASSAKNPVLGVIIIVVAQFFAGGVFVTEQLFLEDINVHPLQAVGIEGFSGLCYYLLVLPIFNIIPCDNPDFCSGGYVENSIEAFSQIADSTVIALCFVGFMISISLFNFTGVTVTRKAGALARSTIDTSRTLLIWFFSIFIGWEQFIGMQLAGFFLLVLGTLIYNEIIKIPWFGMKESIEEKHKYMKMRNEAKHKEVADENEYMGYSPGAVYDSTHYKHKEGVNSSGVSMEFK